MKKNSVQLEKAHRIRGGAPNKALRIKRQRVSMLNGKGKGTGLSLEEVAKRRRSLPRRCTRKQKKHGKGKKVCIRGKKREMPGQAKGSLSSRKRKIRKDQKMEDNVFLIN